MDTIFEKQEEAQSDRSADYTPWLRLSQGLRSHGPFERGALCGEIRSGDLGFFAEVGMYRRSLNKNNLGVIGEVAAIIDQLAVCTDTKLGKLCRFSKEVMAKAAEHALMAEIDDE